MLTWYSLPFYGKLPVYVCIYVCVKKQKLKIYAYELSMYACIINVMCEKLFHNNGEKWLIYTTYTMHYVIRIINYNNNCKYLFAYSRYQQLSIVSEGEDLCIC
jgi:hypothetical protein